MTDFKKLIPELSDWNNGKGIDIASWIGCVGDFQKAIGYSVMFWPQLEEVEGYIIKASVPNKILQGWIQKYNGNRKAIEAMANHLHIRDLQYYGCPDITPERLAYLGTVLKDIYECKLKCQFSDKNFCVELHEGDSGNIDGYELTFYQI